ncbi:MULTISPECIES: cbb3-type cytochrome oxidase subunit 3 [Janthinobacterium]|jgi:cytochrome c oxidase cbb3-type subunit 4|uniref:Cbb3-type cytochrome oxidase subunit CcoQ n=2 Tax=Janthinobacterium TaxID=29580 RepID=A0A1S1U1N7_9BURK|nr:MULTISPECIES: cbb3-type cytochrome c oxidase subunit 3 [Janthinobacterium]MBH1981483.1 cbb3-type cytochrome c oxidase subunit 3 [Burkholderiales bacterium]MBH1995035.1 cbb3-type cytochrome c oxidase subunit 3 [Burkholderiales bacterium]MBH2069050.1 cbb3-type cytochrome c oxidase subunit 3 [Burkholderiales bacterium]MDI3296816.1 cbb3-type cytochrome c oxidase subunit 3 [Janthinobacterium tructae]MDN2699990.1 cbb3-type cytochrome c oxidase subunit 3 [Janthinobacterium sp. SUN073]
MAIENLFDSASSVMTVVSFTTFVGILWWTFSRSNSDFDAAARLPFDDEALDYAADAAPAQGERNHG